MSDTTSIAGFFDSDRNIFVYRTSRKVMQKPRKIGIGLCFENGNPPSNVIDQCRELCQRVGYFGAFEIEFIKVGESYQIIDFSPRFYSQMEFEIRRGLDIPYLVFTAAFGLNLECDQLASTAKDFDDKSQSFKYTSNWLFSSPYFAPLSAEI